MDDIQNVRMTISVGIAKFGSCQSLAKASNIQLHIVESMLREGVVRKTQEDSYRKLKQIVYTK